MDTLSRLSELGLFDLRVPRYTSYPAAPVFDQTTGAEFQRSCLSQLKPDDPVSVYVHIPFCERLCWFCACRTQGTTTMRPVEAYLDTLERELETVRQIVPHDVSMGALHWGGGTPTILLPDHIRRLAEALKRSFGTADPFEFSVEIDPTLVDEAKIAALRDMGMSRASIGIQDFRPDVQAAIGRPQSLDQTRRCVDALRGAGIASLNTDLVYGLPHQTLQSFEETIAQTLTLAPDRIALFGYAHVPWMSKRQKLIDEATLPDDRMRFALAELAAEMFTEAGYRRLGIDHFAKPTDQLCQAAERGELRRNFQGYTEDSCNTLIGLGASALSRFPQGYVQNAPATAAYTQRIEDGRVAGIKGHEFVEDDLMRARVIEMIMCDFALDMSELIKTYGAAAEAIEKISADVVRAFAPFVEPRQTGWVLRPDGRPLARIIASRYDAYAHGSAQFSKAS